jgi:hypothetical protein
VTQNPDYVIEDSGIALGGQRLIGRMHANVLEEHLDGSREGRFGHRWRFALSPEESLTRELVPFPPLDFHRFARRLPSQLAAASALRSRSPAGHPMRSVPRRA